MAAAGVGLGAFGAHGLRDLVPLERLITWETAVRYHLLHALGLVLLGVLSTPTAGYQWCGRLFVLGIALFSGSLYLLVLFDVPMLGALTPFGGVALILAWLLLAFSPDGRDQSRP
ncbi:MAG: DUF423 domain-containing protein [Planctomycetota bacterium]|nr:DUF423 domain-containing protein [Planctomycetota bacterium]